MDYGPNPTERSSAPRSSYITRFRARLALRRRPRQDAGALRSRPAILSAPFADRPQWAYWQWKQNRHGTIAAPPQFPRPFHYDNNGHWNDAGVTSWQKGSFLEDGMWPWDGTSGGMPGRAQRPVNQATASGTNIPTSQPAVPMTAFPASPRRNLWPSVATIPEPRHMVDYLGKFRPQDGLGLCYDDVPY